MKEVVIQWAGLSYWPVILVMLLVVGSLLWYRCYNHYRIINALSTKKRRSQLLLNFYTGRPIVKSIMFFLGFCALSCALLRPQLLADKQTLKQEGRDVLIILDVSRSMLATDLKPNRLEHAKKKITTLLQQLGPERVGLLIFSGSCIVQCPLTTDFDAFKMFLEHIDQHTIASGTTAIDQALRKALAIFEQKNHQGESIVLLFTDGEDFSVDLATFKKQAQQAHMHIFTIGTATVQGAPIPLYNPSGECIGHQKDSTGSVVVSALQEKTLQQLAHDTGGVYLKSDESNRDIQSIIQHVQRFDKQEFDSKLYARWVELYHYCVALSFFILVIEWFL